MMVIVDLVGGVGEIVLVVGGQDWQQVVDVVCSVDFGECIVVNMGFQYLFIYGVLWLILEIEGEIVVEVWCGIGYLYIGIEKNFEYWYWIQGVIFVI